MASFKALGTSQMPPFERTRIISNFSTIYQYFSVDFAMLDVGCGGPRDKSKLKHSDCGLNKHVRGARLTRDNRPII